MSCVGSLWNRLRVKQRAEEDKNMRTCRRTFRCFVLFRIEVFGIFGYLLFFVVLFQSKCHVRVPHREIKARSSS